jgi:hypothetical protein
MVVIERVEFGIKRLAYVISRAGGQRQVLSDKSTGSIDDVS